ncbi:GGDEF and EAL domain-containing protein [Azospirillum sp. SYSU D00513]|uniref:putative bifunctional diguanylate cyclase/phosphodiesterase n=1 Tax=Azospirillum sp. SYSU D00513 TaxID=2812561 RepID=UPI001A96C8C9|nr:GGDEF and EAL domain-containing protein [Azospirillum sp. SYSU D00513]
MPQPTSGDSLRLALPALALAASGDIAYVWDIGSDTVRWEGGPEALMHGARPPGPDGANLISGDELRARINPQDLIRRRKALSRHIETGEPFDCDYRLRLPNGAIHWVHDRGRVEQAASGVPARLCGVLRVIDHRKAYEVELEHQAHFDPMTGLLNRHRLCEILNAATEEAGQLGRSSIYLAVGIDKLGLVNDAMGHAVADAVVQEVARRLRRALRPGDTVGRSGGDIFGIVLPHCPEHSMVQVAEKLLRAVRAQPVATPAGPVHVTVSVGGVAARREDAVRSMTRAETALQEAKRQGRDCFWPHHATSAAQSELRASLAAGQAVNAAIQAETLRFAFQPVVDSDGCVAFYECLLRLPQPDGTVLNAGAFMPAVERLGMARRVDHQTLALAMRALEENPDVSLALNLSATTTADRTWLTALEEMLRERPGVASRLIIEVTESAVIEDLEETAAFLAAVRAHGCRTALDDFGAGYLSYRHLRSLPVDIVKIDGSFVREMAECPDALLFIRTLVMLAKGFGLATVAEFVETEEQATALRREGVRMLQGYRFGRPSLDRPCRDGLPAVAEPATG